MGLSLRGELERLGFSEVYRALAAGDALSSEQQHLVDSADLHIVGALAHEIRKHFFDNKVELWTSEPPKAGVVIVNSGSAQATGLDWMMSVARTRIAHPRSHVAVSWAEAGAELAQVTLAYGATMLHSIPASVLMPMVDKYKGNLREDLPRQLALAGFEARWSGPSVSAKSKDHEAVL